MAHKVTASSGRAVIYLRVSSEQQAESGLGIEAQRAACQAAAARLGLVVTGEFADAGISGTRELDNRPGLFAAVNALRRGDTLLVAKRDRVGRDVFLMVSIERTITRKGARLVSAAGEGTESDDPGAVFQRHVLDGAAQYERALIAARTRAALQAKRARGERAGNLPFGYQLAADGVKLEPAPAEQHVLSLMRELRAAGLTFAAIVDALNAQGFRTRRGTPWGIPSVYHVLVRAAA